MSLATAVIGRRPWHSAAAAPPASANPAAGSHSPQNQGKNSVSVTEQPFGQTADGTKETLLTCTNASGNQVKLTTYGARIVAVMVPDRAGKRANVTLGFDTLEPYCRVEVFSGLHDRPIRQPDREGKIRARRRRLFASRRTTAPTICTAACMALTSGIWAYKTLRKPRGHGGRVQPAKSRRRPRISRHAGRRAWRTPGRTTTVCRSITPPPAISRPC